MYVQIFFDEEVVSTQDTAREALTKNFAFGTDHSAISKQAAANARLAAKEGIAVFTAKKQTKGRGRNGRPWLSPKEGNLYLTLATNLPNNIATAPLSLVTACAVCETLQQFLFQPAIKWPNDILLKEKKVGGILCEIFSQERELFLLCGIGLNVNMQANSLSRIDRPATSLAIEGGRFYPLLDLLHVLVARWAECYSFYLNHGFAFFQKKVESWLAHAPGDPVRFHQGNQIITGSFIGLTKQGACLIQQQTGEIRPFFSGEIFRAH